MEIKDFFTAQVHAVGQVAGTLDAIRNQLDESGAPPECTAAVLANLQTIFDRHSAMTMISSTDSPTVAAGKVEQLFRPIVNDLLFELVRSLVENWVTDHETD